MKIPYTNSKIEIGFSLERFKPGFYKYPRAERQNSIMNKYTSETSAQFFGIYVSYTSLVAIF